MNIECGSNRARAPRPSRRADSWRAGRSPGSDAPLRPFPTVASRQWVASRHRSIGASLQSRGRLRHHTGFPITQARLCRAKPTRGVAESQYCASKTCRNSRSISPNAGSSPHHVVAAVDDHANRSNDDSQPVVELAARRADSDARRSGRRCSSAAHRAGTSLTHKRSRRRRAAVRIDRADGRTHESSPSPGSCPASLVVRDCEPQV